MESLVDVSEADYRSTERVEEAARDELLKLIEMYEAAVFNFLTVLLRDRSAAQDCAQDAFLRAYERLRRGQEVNAAWLYRVARNRAIDELRRRKRVSTETQDVEELPDRETGGQHASVREALAQLSPGDREQLYLFDIDGFDAREIGEMLGISRNAVHVRVFRARERFRKIYRPIGETP